MRGTRVNTTWRLPAGGKARRSVPDGTVPGGHFWLVVIVGGVTTVILGVIGFSKGGHYVQNGLLLFLGAHGRGSSVLVPLAYR
jgi:hypothetical protein